MSQKPEKKQSGKVNYVWVLAGGYLVYLAIQIFKVLFSGNSSQPVIGALGGVAFVVIGAGLMLREWKHYRYGQEHIDDPTTWSDEEDEELPENPDKEAAGEGEEDA